MVKIWVGFGLVLLSASAMAGSVNGLVVEVTDGDTLVLLTEDRVRQRVRLAEIDAPEKKQPFGSAAKTALASWAFKKQAVVDVEDVDRYGRVVGTVHVQGSAAECRQLGCDAASRLNVNLLQVRAGMAWAYRQYAKSPSIYAAERAARATRTGLWQDPTPVPPWEWRRAR